MFLRATKRFKDGKIHYYWSMVENVRVGRRVFRRQALYLGELNDSQCEEWQRTIEAFDEKGNVRQLKLFQEDRAPETDDGRVVRIRRRRTVAGRRESSHLPPDRDFYGQTLNRKSSVLGTRGGFRPRLQISSRPPNVHPCRSLCGQGIPFS